MVKKIGRRSLVVAGLVALWPAMPAFTQTLGNPVALPEIPRPRALDPKSFFEETPPILPIAPNADLPKIPAPGSQVSFTDTGSGGVVQGAYSSPAAVPQKVVQAGGAQAKTDSGIKQASCTSCSKGLLGSLTYGSGGWHPKTCGPNLHHCQTGPGQCVPGRPGCCSNGGCGTGSCGDSVHGRLIGGLYECLCCPDPCYEPRWVAAANNAFWADGPRPVTQARLRYDAGYNFQRPDRAEFFWARGDGNGRGPNITNVPAIRYDVINLYTEAAPNQRFSIFTNIPYMQVHPENLPSGSGFADMTVGTKAVLCDCELFLLTFQFATILPVGSTGKGLGTGHVSLEPSLLWALKLTPTTYFQGQVAEWCPISGDPIYAGAVCHYHLSINQILYRFHPDVALIGSAEFNGYSFQDGAYTDTVLGAFQSANDTTYLNVGPGVRLVFCDKLDFGVSAVFSLSDPGPAQIYRAELRYRF